MRQSSRHPTPSNTAHWGHGIRTTSIRDGCRGFHHSFLASSLLCLMVEIWAACANPPAPVAPTPLSNQSEASSEPVNAPAAPSANHGLLSGAFGGAYWGFVEGSSANGRIVFIRHFPGSERPSFGHHGESMGGQPILTAFDRVTGEEREVAELIEVNATRRWFLALTGDGAWLVDGIIGAWTPLDEVDMPSDGNACLPPRQASFSANGKRVGWVEKGATRLHVRDLETGDTWTIAAKGPLWRGWPDDQGRGAVLAEIPAGQTGWPIQNTSCACRWCNRFALSYGFYGWSGPAFALEHVNEDGTRSPGEPAENDAPVHGATDSGCTLTASKTEQGLDFGPWRWVCDSSKP